ncbi:MAG: hypothetical protein KKB50_19950 [Planctomycetes bacterium]|nr:hypothetical protein [Planctomycetota bacterium]
MTRLRGRAPRGERLIDKTPHGHWKTTTLIAALGIGGMRWAIGLDWHAPSKYALVTSYRSSS